MVMFSRFFLIEILSLLVLFNLTGSKAFAQKTGYVDVAYLVSKMPDYQKVQGELNQASTKWQKEIEDMFAEVEKLKKEYQAEEILMTEEMRKEKMLLITTKEKAAREKQKKVFGFEGLLYLKRVELVKPLQEKVFEAVEKISKQKKVMLMYDKSSSMGLIYADPKHDYTDFVMEELGIVDKEKTESGTVVVGGKDGQAPGAGGGTGSPAGGGNDGGFGGK